MNCGVITLTTLLPHDKTEAPMQKSDVTSCKTLRVEKMRSKTLGNVIK